MHFSALLRGPSVPFVIPCVSYLPFSLSSMMMKLKVTLRWNQKMNGKIPQGTGKEAYSFFFAFVQFKALGGLS